MPRAKPLPALPEAPPRHAMRASWRDPDDVTPGARRAAKEIHGWRTLCPLRRMSGHPASSITAMHLMAADKLREYVDLAMLGYSSPRPLIYVAQMSQPRWGLGPAELAQVQAIREVNRVILLFSRPQLVMVEFILLRNMTVRQWANRIAPPLNQKQEKRKLMVILDRLVEYYDSELKSDIAQGRRLVP